MEADSQDLLEPRRSELRRVEESSLNAWPALQQLVLDGWLLRFAEGYTKRANSVTPLYASVLDVDEKIRRCEAIYASRGLPAIFRLTPLAQPVDLDARLAARGYGRLDPTRVEILDLTGWQGSEVLAPSVREMSPDEWVATYETFSGKVLPSAHLSLICSIPMTRHLVCLEHEGRAVACGMTVVEPPYVGLFSILTAPQHRNRGFGRSLVEGVLAQARLEGARRAYLQVQEDNGAARHLYAKIGFRPLYTYWYRVASRTPL